MVPVRMLNVWLHFKHLIIFKSEVFKLKLKHLIHLFSFKFAIYARHCCSVWKALLNSFSFIIPSTSTCGEKSDNNSYEDKLNAIVKLESYIFEYIDFFASFLLNEASKEKKWSYDQKQIQKLLNARVNITSISNDLIILEKSKCSIITNIRTLVNYLYDVYELVYFSFEILNIYKSKNLTKKNKSKINKIKNNFEKLNIIFWLKFMRNLLTHSIFMQGYNSEKKQVSYENLKTKLNFAVKNNLIMLSEKQIFNKNKIINQQLKKNGLW